jgi:hypothetical protein
MMGKPGEKRPLGKPRRRLKDNIMACRRVARQRPRKKQLWNSHNITFQHPVAHLLLENITASIDLKFFKSFSTSYYTTHFDRYDHIQVFKIVVFWKLLCFHFRSPSLFEHGLVYALVYPIVVGPSSCCVYLCVFVYGPVCALVYPKVIIRFSCCLVCVCMWSRLCASASHGGGSSLLLCCVCFYVVQSVRCVPRSDCNHNKLNTTGRTTRHLQFFCLRNLNYWERHYANQKLIKCCRVLVTRRGVWTGNSIYWRHAVRNYKSL